MSKGKLIYLIAGAACLALAGFMAYLTAVGIGSVVFVIGPLVFGIAFLASAFSMKTPDQKRKAKLKSEEKKKLMRQREKEEKYVSPFFKD